MAGKLFAIFWRDVLSTTSYRLSFLLQFFGPLFMVLSFFFLSRLLEETSLTELERYGGDYFSFVLVGILFSTYTSVFLHAVVSTIRGGQRVGTLELILTTQTNMATYLVGSSLYSLLRSTIVTVIFLTIGAIAFGVNFQGANILGGVLVLALALLAVVGLGVISGSFILVYKQGDPVSMAVGAGVFLLSGVLYPVEVLPRWLQIGSWALPHTHGLEALRLTLLQGASLSVVSTHVVALAVFGAALFLAGLMSFTYALHRARIDGSFSQY